MSSFFAFSVLPLVLVGFVGPLVAGLYLAAKLNGRRSPS